MISIIITNYNKEKYIKRTLESCKNQTDKNFEIIFFNDASTDKSYNFANNFHYKNRRIKIKFINQIKKKYKHSNLNQFYGVLTALKFCKGEYISLLDADDFFLPNKIKDLNHIIKLKKKKIIYNSYILNDKKKEIVRKFKKRFLIWPTFPPTSCLTVEKKLFKKIIKKIYPRNNLTCYLDYRFALYVSKYYFEEIYYTHKKLTIYNQENEGVDSQYRNIHSILYWKRKFEALKLLIFL